MYGDNCYTLVNDKETWNNAQQRCEEDFSGHLADVESDEHLEWIWQLSEGRSVWIGTENNFLPLFPLFTGLAKHFKCRTSLLQA